MYVFDIENKSSLKDVLLENLKTLGVRCRLPKKVKENEKENVYSDIQIFQKPLHLLKKRCTRRLDGSTVEVPEFIIDSCGVIEKDIKTEGIFRKAGSTCKQKERKIELNQGKRVSYDYHVFDACSLVKLFFRELPQPIIPYAYHDIFLKCLLLSTYEKELDALMLACLLMPEENLATLAFFMEFLLKVSWHADRNKMNIKNLSIILTPTLMPIRKGTRASNNLEMGHHFKVVEMLIENAERIGRVPDHILEKLMSNNKKQSKKKRRSNSLTKMFTGLKKIVQNRSSTASDWNDSIVSTPDSLPSSLRKRKNADSSSKTSLSSKKQCLSDSSPVRTLTPLRCRMHGYSSNLCSVLSPISSNLKRTCTTSPQEKIQPKKLIDQTRSKRGFQEVRSSRLNLVRRCTTKKQKSESQLHSSSSMGNLFSFETEKDSLEKELSLIWRNKKSSQSNLLTFKNDLDFQEENSESAVDLSDSEFITVHKSEYEEIKNRVSALEEDLEKLNAVHSIQKAYEKTLEESERLSEGSTDQLAKRLSRELKIRRSLENKVIRSPSARKIGSIRRRSREIVPRSSEPKSNLKRGRPNTVQTGLPSPRIRALSAESFPSPKKTPTVKSSTFHEEKVQWKSGDIFFAKDNAIIKPISTPQGRPSVAEIRCQNAGMVLEKAKLFNALNESRESGTKIPRRQSVRLENLRRINDAEKSLKKSLTRTRSLGSDKKPKSSPLFIAETGIHPRIVEEIKETIHEVYTPKTQRLHANRRETPVIKKSLVTRSPRSFARTPLSQVRSSQRNRTTPLKAFVDAGGTPHVAALRRSPRILARGINTSSRLRD